MIKATSKKNGPPFSNIRTVVGLFIARGPESGWVSVDIYTDDAVLAVNCYTPHALSEGPFHILRVFAGNHHDFLQRYRLVDSPPAIDARLQNHLTNDRSRSYDH